VSREQIIELVPDRKFSYINLDGMLQDYRGDVTLTSSSKGGTEISWRGIFRMSFPLAGWFMQLYLTRFTQRGVDKLARHAELIQDDSTDPG
jgi:Polyketide cyclase / dehydrase and lipid transport